MFNTSPQTLKVLASLVWYSGAVILTFKSIKMLLEAYSIKPVQIEIAATILAGLLLGAIKTKYLFTKINITNLKRIDALETPRIWECYRKRFYLFLLSMVILASFMARQAHGNYSMLIAMAFIEISLATALLGSSRYFWKNNQSDNSQPR